MTLMDSADDVEDYEITCTDIFLVYFFIIYVTKPL